MTVTASPSTAQRPLEGHTIRGQDPNWLNILLAIVALGFVLRFGVQPIGSQDAWLHLRIGNFLLGGGRFTALDPWASFSSEAYLPTQWLPEVITAWVQSRAGNPGVEALRTGSILLLLSTLLVTARAVADLFPSQLASLAAIVGAGGSLSERPQMVGFILLAATSGAWWAMARDRRPRWWLVPTTWLWACSHGSWIVGIALGLIFVTGLTLDRVASRKTLLRLWAIPLLSAAAAGLTPLGPAVLLNPLRVNGNVAEYIQEWQPSSIHNPFMATVMVMGVLILLVWLRRGATPPAAQMLVFALAIFCTLWMGRLVAVGAILLAPLLASSLQDMRRNRPTRASHREWLGLAAAVGGTAIAGALIAARIAVAPAGVPVGLAPTIDSIPPRTVVFADQGQTGWLLWRHPHIRPTVDLRSEIYSANALETYLKTEAALPGWEGRLDSTGAAYALLRRQSALSAALANSRTWERVGSADGYLLYRRLP